MARRTTTMKTGVEGTGGCPSRNESRMGPRDVRRRLRVGIVAKEDVARAIRRRRRRRRGRAGGWKYRAWKLSQNGRKLLHDGEFRPTFACFLRNGRYPTLLERALARAISVISDRRWARVVDFEYLNQQLAWRELFRARALHAPIFVLDARAVDARCADITRG